MAAKCGGVVWWRCGSSERTGKAWRHDARETKESFMLMTAVTDVDQLQNRLDRILKAERKVGRLSDWIGVDF